MSVSDETYFEKFQAFTAKLYPFFAREDVHKLASVMDSMKYAPEHLRYFLAAYAEMLEAQKPLEDKIDEAQYYLTPDCIPERVAERRARCDTAWELISLWDAMVDTCGGVEAVAEKAKTVVFFDGQIIPRAS